MLLPYGKEKGNSPWKWNHRKKKSNLNLKGNYRVTGTGNRRIMRLGNLITHSKMVYSVVVSDLAECNVPSPEENLDNDTLTGEKKSNKKYIVY